MTADRPYRRRVDSTRRRTRSCCRRRHAVRRARGRRPAPGACEEDRGQEALSESSEAAPVALDARGWAPEGVGQNRARARSSGLRASAAGARRALLALQQVEQRAAEQHGVPSGRGKRRPPSLPQPAHDRGAQVRGLARDPGRGALAQPRPADVAAEGRDREGRRQVRVVRADHDVRVLVLRGEQQRLARAGDVGRAPLQRAAARARGSRSRRSSRRSSAGWPERQRAGRAGARAGRGSDAAAAGGGPPPRRPGLVGTGRPARRATPRVRRAPSPPPPHARSRGGREGE